ncbi:MAG: hypothetical protein GWN01_15140, partial [Nitrosopumilaceae archaeon]|nr:hypothetical protein [Nitrosopumilaceae archaeon]NIU88652.1 hypothetical protein [Nitrosopumilaceae archaeon]NIV66799.1 hypothetical protein [Nitrosopumilaceae archaeon]NIX62781.1 hypothetical protein [Nitrosopumilaceae archaeon]
MRGGSIKDFTNKGELFLKGIPASPGINIGPCFIYKEPDWEPELRIIDKENVDKQIKRFRRSVKKSLTHLKTVAQETGHFYGKDISDILNLQIAILKDEIFLKEVEDAIQNENYDAASATYKVFRDKREHFMQLSNSYFRDRAFDIQNLKRLLIKNILGKPVSIQLKKPAIVIAD